jgi:metal-dependent amidase/aminoacylase/carboxypeptidase family protein
MDRTFTRRTLLGGAAAAGLAAGMASTPLAFAHGRTFDREIDPRTVDAMARRFDADLIRLRRDIHVHPEVAGQERRTSQLVANRLDQAGLDVATGVGGYGVVGVIRGARPGRTVAYRADMDAVPPNAQINGGPNLAHVCGHDIHTAVAVGVAEVLSRLRHRLAGTVMIICQPAEENLSGAAAMLADGVFDAVRPAEIHALHCSPFPVGQFAVTGGYGLPGLDHATITLSGENAATRSEQLAAKINALGTVAPPASPADLERVVADIQIPDGPLAEFVFMRAQAVSASTDATSQVQLSYRCWEPERYIAVREDIQQLAETYDATAIFPPEPFPALVCSEPDGHAVERYLRNTLGRDRVPELHAAIPFSGEDFALFLDQLPGTYTFIGVRAPGASIDTSYPHFGAFNPDERAICLGVRAMTGWLAQRTER